MKTSSNTRLGVALAVAMLTIRLIAEPQPAGYVDFGKLPRSASGREFVEVNVNGNLLGIVARLASKQEPEVADLLGRLQSVRVNVIGLDDANRAAAGERIQAIRDELDSRGWARVVTVKEKAQDVGVHLKTRGQEAIEGVVVTVNDGSKEAVLVNIVGDIQPEKIAAIAEKLHIEPLKKVAEAIEKKGK